MLRLFIISLVCLVVASCAREIIYKPHRVSTHEEVGDVHVSATMVGRWDDFITDLTPRFTLSAEDAKNEVLARTAAFENQTFDSLRVALKLANTGSEAAAALGSAAEGESENADAGESGGAATQQDLDAAGNALPAPTSSVLTGNLKPTLPTDVETDPILTYTTANALLQEVAILNKHVKNAVQRHGALAYIVRLQVTVAPYARNQPYDTHMVMSFRGQAKCVVDPKGNIELTGQDAASADLRREAGDPDVPIYTDGGSVHREGGDQARDQVLNIKPGVSQCPNSWREAQVVPLLVTDNIETRIGSQSLQTIRQLSAAASVFSGGIAGFFSADRRLDRLNAILAQDFNSLITVGRVTRNTMYMRFGAMQAATSEYAMAPRNFNVTALVLVDQPQNVGELQQLRMASTVTFRDAETGKALPREDASDRAKRAADVLANYDPEEGADLKKLGGRALGHMFQNDFESFRSLLKEANISRSRASDVWNELAETVGRSGFIGDRVDLPESLPPQWPKKQAVLLVDDGKRFMRAQLVGGVGLTSDIVAANLVLPGENSTELSLPAQRISFGARGGDPLLFFSSPKALGLKFDNGKVPAGGKLELSLKPALRSYRQITPEIEEAEFSDGLFYQLTAKEQEPTLVVVTASATKVVPSKSDQGSLKVHVRNPDSAPTITPTQITLTGADIQKVTQGDDKALAAIGARLSGGILFVTKAGTYNFTLNNLEPKSDINIGIKPDKGATPAPLKFTVAERLK